MATTESSEVKAVLHYGIQPEGQFAFSNTFIDPTTGERQSNISREVKDVIIENVRGKEHTVGLDTTGFQCFNAPAKHKSFVTDEEIEREYYPESIELIKKLTGASRVVLFDHTVRRHRPGETEDAARRGPALFAHVDQSPKAALARVYRHLPADEASELVKKRFQIINLWRPISHSAYDHPLALCDYRSVEPEKDIFPVRLVYPDREGETLGVKYSSKYRWKYLRGMTPDEVVTFRSVPILCKMAVCPYLRPTLRSRILLRLGMLLFASPSSFAPSCSTTEATQIPAKTTLPSCWRLVA